MQSRIASTDGARHFSANSTTEASTKPACVIAFRHSAGSLKRKIGGAGGSETCVLPCASRALSHDRKKIVPVGTRPDRESKTPIGTQHPICLGDRFVGIGDVKNAEGADDRVEACRVERKVLGGALAKINQRIAPSRRR